MRELQLSEKRFGKRVFLERSNRRRFVGKLGGLARWERWQAVEGIVCRFVCLFVILYLVSRYTQPEGLWQRLCRCL